MTTYRVNDLYPCIQGEGSLTGTAMMLIRLMGCSVGCSFCDTKETWVAEKRNFKPLYAFGTNANWTELSPEGIVSLYKSKHGELPAWALITGGEPAEQELFDLVWYLRSKKMQVAVETSGTAAGVLSTPIDWLCCSPKLHKPINAGVIKVADELKFVVGKESDIEKIDDFLKRYETSRGVSICLQPMSQSEKATEICIKECMRRDWRLSIQLHKYLNQR